MDSLLRLALALLALCAPVRKEGRVIAAHHSLLRAGGGSVALAGTGALSVVDTANALPSNFSASIWVRAHNSPTYGCAIKIGKPQPSGGQGSGAGIGYGDTRFGGGGSGPGWPGSNLVVLAESVAWTNGNVSFPITDWNHLLFIKNGLLVTVYKNGELVYSNTFTAIHSDTKTEIYVGGYEDTSSNPIRYLPCNLTRFAMWNYALSASEAVADYAARSRPPVGAAHYWPLNSDDFLSDKIGSISFTAGTGGSFTPESPF